jgi:hypothetical protein
LVTVNGEILLVSRDFDVCEFSIDDSPPFRALVVNHPNGKVCKLTLHGRSAGRTKLLAIDNGTKELLDPLIVSVKTQRLITYNLHRLQDLRRSTKRTFEDLHGIMQRVEDTYLKQANIRLQRVHEQDTLIRDDLSDPIQVDPEPGGGRDHELPRQLRAKIREHGLDKDTINFVSTWNMVGQLGQTPDFLTLCLCRAWDGPPVEEAIIYAHELGHALGMRHEDHDNQFLMFVGPVGSFRLSQFDIDRMNASGTRFKP